MKFCILLKRPSSAVRQSNAQCSDMQHYIDRVWLLFVSFGSGGILVVSVLRAEFSVLSPFISSNLPFIERQPRRTAWPQS